MVATISAMNVNGDTVSGVSDLSDGRSMSFADMAVEGDHIYVLAHESLQGTQSVHLRYFNGIAWLPWLQVSDVNHSWAGKSSIDVENGTAHIVFEAEEGNRIAGIYHRAFENGTFNSATWVGADEYTGHMNHVTPDVAVSGDVVHVVWNKIRSPNKGIQYRWMNATGWSEVKRIGPMAGGIDLSNPVIAAEGPDVHVAWIYRYKSYYTNVHLKYTRWNGSIWSTEVYVSGELFRYSEPKRPDIVAANGTAHIVWEELVDKNISILYRSIKGREPGKTVLIDQGLIGDKSHLPSVAIIGERTFIAWLSGNASISTDVLVRTFDGESWKPTQTLDGGLDLDIQSHPKVSIGGGRVNVGWSASRYGGHSSLYWSALLEDNAPNSKAGPANGYWADAWGLAIPWTAVDDQYLGRIGLYYRFSEDNVTWSNWLFASGIDKLTIMSANGTFVFTALQGDGFYEVVTRAEDMLGNAEALTPEGGVTVAFDTAPPICSFFINGTSPGLTSDRNLTLDLSYHDEMTGRVESLAGKPFLLMRIGQHNFGPADGWTLVKAQATIELQGWDGTKTIRMQFMDLAGHISDTFSVAVVLDTTRPSGSLVVAGGINMISSSPVVVDLKFEDETSGPVTFRLSNDGVWDDEEWQPLRDSLYWDLDEGEGARSVFLQVMDKAGWVSQTAADHLVIDLEPPIGNVTIIPKNASVGTRPVLLLLEFRDDLSSVTGIRLSNDGVWDDEPWQEPLNVAMWTLEDGSGVKTVHLQVKDEWGHVSETFTDSIALDLEPPNATMILLDADETRRSLDLELMISFWDVTTQVEAMRLSEDPSWQGVPWEAPSGTRTFRLSTGDGVKTIYLQVKDSVGHLSNVVQVDVRVDTMSPTIVGTNPGPFQVGVESTTEIYIVFSERMDHESVVAFTYLSTKEGEVILGHYRLYKNDTILFFVPDRPLKNGTRYTLVMAEGITDRWDNPMEQPYKIEFQTEQRATGGGPTGDGQENASAIHILIVIFMAASVVMALVLMRKRRWPRRPAERGVS